MPLATFRIGRRAERRAARFLKRTRGYTLVEKNVRAGRGEIDIIALDGDVIVFVEVRYRADGIGPARESVSGAKLAALRDAIRAYRSAEGLWSVETRIDVVSVSREGRRWRIEHTRGIES